MTRLVVGVAVGLLVPALALGATHRVPEDFATIRAAIGSASASQIDTVLVGPGTWSERIYIRKNLVLRGRDGAAVTTLDGQLGGNVVTMNNVSRACIIEDLTITGGASTGPDSVGAAIYLNTNASPTVQRCRLVGNQARTGGGLDAYVFCQPLLKDCWIADNEGGAVVFELDNFMSTTWAEMTNCVVVNNQGFAVYALKSARVWIRNCTFAYNAGDGVRTDQSARVRVWNSIITHNGGAGIKRDDNTVCFTLQCNDVFQNTGGNYFGANPQDPCFTGRGSGDVTLDPSYQNVEAENFHLQSTSPLCILDQPGSCGQLGAYDDPCSGGSGPCVVRVEPTTWTAMKRLYN
jgi:nitrous oxidase accessory protein NosD